MNDGEPDVEVEITLLRTDEGGRTTPCRSGYRPPFYYDGQYWIAFYVFPADDWIQPGDTVRALVTFLKPESHRGRLYPGKEFELREGSHLVARGRVTRLMSLGTDPS